MIAAPAQVHKSVTSPNQRKPISAAKGRRANSNGAQALASAAANARATEMGAIVPRQPRPARAPKVDRSGVRQTNKAGTNDSGVREIMKLARIVLGRSGRTRNLEAVLFIAPVAADSNRINRFASIRSLPG